MKSFNCIEHPEILLVPQDGLLVYGSHVNVSDLCQMPLTSSVPPESTFSPSEALGFLSYQLSQTTSNLRFHFHSPNTSNFFHKFFTKQADDRHRVLVTVWFLEPADLSVQEQASKAASK